MGRCLLLAAGLLFLYATASNTVQPEKLVSQLPQLAFLLVLIWLLFRRGSLLTRGGNIRVGAVSLLLVGVVAVTLAGMFAWVDYRLSDLQTPEAPGSPYKVWSTRGLVIGGTVSEWNGTQNSIESIRRAFEHGAKGVEVDVFFDPPLNQFVVSHDYPYFLKNGELLLLRDLLAELGDQGMFWLDWKKLRYLEPDDFQQALDELMVLTAVGNLRDRFYVEGEDPVRIGRIAQSGLLTILDTHPLPDGNFFTPLVNSLYKSLFYFGGHTVMGIESGPTDAPIFGPRSSRILKDVPLFVYHVPDDPVVIELLASQNNVRVILPRDHRKDLFSYQPDPGP